MFPSKLECWDGSVCHRINLKAKLREVIPYFLRFIQHDSTFHVSEIESVVVVSVDVSDRDDGEWGSGLRVFLTNQRYFQIYLAFLSNDIHPYLEELQEELQSSVHVFSTNEPLQDIFYKHNMYLLDDSESDTFTLYAEDLFRQ